MVAVAHAGRQAPRLTWFARRATPYSGSYPQTPHFTFFSDIHGNARR